MKEWFSCHPQYPLPGSLQLYSPLERNLSTICKVSCLFHYAATCYYKHIYVLCFSTQMQPCRDSSQTKPISRGRMSNSCGKKLFLLCPTKLFIHEECLSSGLLILERLSERDSEKSKSNFTNPMSISLNISATNHKRPHLFIYVTVFTYMSNSRHQKQRCPTSSGIFGNFVHKPLFCVIVWPHLAARGLSGCPCSLRLCCH